jgi:DNA-binding MarR family transcriptional regulator
MSDPHALGSDLVTYAARLVRAIRREVEHPAGVRVLSILDEVGPQSITALAAVDRCSQPTMSATVAQLVEHGWVSKAPNPEDARGSLVAPTPAGRAELRRIRSLHGDLIAARVAAHSTHTVDDVARAVTLLRDLLDTSTEENPHR